MKTTDNKYKNHPSYASLYIGRSHCSGEKVLFGSSIKHHDTITLKISPASFVRNLNSDHYYADPNSYVEIEMSQAQFAQAITSMNNGDGIPVTLRKLNGEYIEPCPFEDKRVQFDNELKQEMKELSKKISDITRETEQIIESKRVFTKGDKEKILSVLQKVQLELLSNIPFVFLQFNKQMDKTVAEAKSEVEAHIQSRMEQLAYKEQNLKNSDENIYIAENDDYDQYEGNNEYDEFDESYDSGNTMGGMINGF